jgi:hypothetical protein
MDRVDALASGAAGDTKATLARDGAAAAGRGTDAVVKCADGAVDGRTRGSGTFGEGAAAAFFAAARDDFLAAAASAVGPKPARPTSASAVKNALLILMAKTVVLPPGATEVATPARCQLIRLTKR